MASQWKKRYQLKQQRRKVPSNRAALEEAKFFREQNTELTERMRHLINALSQWDIDVSWDGLRHFWSIELTENGCLMRDRACKAEAENAKLREQVTRLQSDWESEKDYADQMGSKEKKAVAENAKLRDAAERDADVMESLNLSLEDAQTENAKLRELCIDMASHLREAERIHGDELLPEGYITRMRELGIEV